MVKSDITQGLHRMRFVMFRCYESKTRARNVSITGSTCQLIDRPWIVINFLPIHLQLSIFFLSFFVRLNISLKCWPLRISPKCIWIYWARDSGSSRCRLEVQKTLRRVHLTNLQSRFFSPWEFKHLAIWIFHFVKFDFRSKDCKVMQIIFGVSAQLVKLVFYIVQYI